MLERPRLLPAVILGAMGLLALKLLAWTAEPGPGHIPVPLPLMAQAPVAKTVARAHAPGVFDPETTGSVPAPAPKKEEEKKEAEAKAEAEETFSGCGYVESLGVAKSKWMAMASWMSADVFVRKVGCGARGGERSVVLAHDECALAVAVSEDGKDVVVMLRDGRVVAWRGTREVERGTLAMVGRRRRGDGTTREEETAARRFVVRVDGDHAVWSRVVGFLGWSS